MTPSDRLRTLPRPMLEALRRELGPQFANDQQRAFFDSRHPEVLYSGAFGAGKSRIRTEVVGIRTSASTLSSQSRNGFQVLNPGNSSIVSHSPALDGLL